MSSYFGWYSETQGKYHGYAEYTVDKEDKEHTITVTSISCDPYSRPNYPDVTPLGRVYQYIRHFTNLQETNQPPPNTQPLFFPNLFDKLSQFSNRCA